MLSGSENQFSLTRVALGTCGRAKSGFLSASSSTNGLTVTSIGDRAFRARLVPWDRDDARLLGAGSLVCVAGVGFVGAEALNERMTP
jgi:hypothetical protein